MTMHIKRSNSLSDKDLTSYNNHRLNDKNVLRKLKRSYSFAPSKFLILLLWNIWTVVLIVPTFQSLLIGHSHAENFSARRNNKDLISSSINIAAFTPKRIDVKPRSSSLSPKRSNTFDDNDIPPFLPIPSNHKDFSVVEFRNLDCFKSQNRKRCRRTFPFSYTKSTPSISLKKKNSMSYHTPIEPKTFFLDDIPSDLCMPSLNF